MEGIFWWMSVGMLYDWGVVYNCEVGLRVPFLIGYIYGLLIVYLVIFFQVRYILYFSHPCCLLCFCLMCSPGLFWRVSVEQEPDLEWGGYVYWPLNLLLWMKWGEIFLLLYFYFPLMIN